LYISAGLLAYVYAGYPALVWAWSRIWPRPVARGTYAGGVSVLISAHGEPDALERKIEALLELAQTEPIREIWIGLDGWEPGAPRDRRRGLAQVHVLAFGERRGKAAVLNDLMERATQPILAMMDVRQRIEPGAMGALLAPFADASVGVVSGALEYERADGGAAKGAQSYWSYEKMIREAESRIWAVPGATGAFYAIRRELCRPIPPQTLVDDVLIPMRAVLAGHRCLFEPRARVFDWPTTDYRQENLRKRRTLAGIWQMMRIEPRVLSPAANPIWVQWTSHKALRLLTPMLAATALGSLAALGSARGGAWAAAAWAAVSATAASAAAYWGGRRFRSRALGVLGAFFGVNWALLLAACDAARGRFDPKWRRAE
jgi:poly-beta-1,6-N-acetyl-D-glucosamine synthase